MRKKMWGITFWATLVCVCGRTTSTISDTVTAMLRIHIFWKLTLC